MRPFLIAIGAAILAFAFATDADADHRRWFVDDASGVIVALSDDPGASGPDGSTAVFDETIRMADPPGPNGSIYQGAIWDGTDYTYTPPVGAVLPLDPSTAVGAARIACRDMLDVFETALDYIYDNQLAWRQEAVRNAATGIHRQLVNATRVALNTTRTHARRQKYCEESASWPTGLSGDVVQYVEAMGGNTVATPTKDWSWVNPTTDARTDVMGAANGFGTATDVENAPTTDRLISRSWIRDIQ